MNDQCPKCLTGRTASYGCATTDPDGDVTQRVVCSTCGFATWRVEARRAEGAGKSATYFLYDTDWSVHQNTVDRCDAVGSGLPGLDLCADGRSEITKFVTYMLLESDWVQSDRLAGAPATDLREAHGPDLDAWAKWCGTERQVTLGLVQTWTETDDELRDRLTETGRAVVGFFEGLRKVHVAAAVPWVANIDLGTVSILGVPVSVAEWIGKPVAW